MTDGARALGIDVGGTKTTALVLDERGTVLDRATETTPADDQEATLATIERVAASLMSSNVVAAGIGAAGLVETSTGRLLFAPNLAWRDVPLADRMRATLGVPVIVDNDCTAAAWGEFRLGSARGHRHVLYVGIGTGIGGGLVIDGAIYHGSTGLAGEIGHIVVDPDGHECGCGNRGCWETLASGSAIEREGIRSIDRHTRSLIAELAEGDPSRVTGAMVTDAARRGDATARGILTEVGHRLGQGLAGLVNVLDPEVVVVGGGAAGAGELLLEPARTAYLIFVEDRSQRPPVSIVEGTLGVDAAAMGAALLALDAAG